MKILITAVAGVGCLLLMVAVPRPVLAEEPVHLQPTVRWEYLSDQRWDHAQHFVGGYAVVWREQSGYGLINEKGQVVVEPIWDEIGSNMGLLEPGPFYEGLCAVKREGKWGFADESGKVVIEPKWDLVSAFRGGNSTVNLGGRDTPTEEEQRKGLSIDWEPGGKWGIIDKTGKVLVEPEWDDIGPLAGEGFYMVAREGTWGILKKDGTEIVEPEWEDFRIIGENLYAVMRGGKWGVIKPDGTVVVKLVWDEIGSFLDEIAPVKLNGKWGAVDENGEVMIEPVWRRLNVIHNGRAFVSSGENGLGPWGMIDKTGKVWVKPEWDTISGIGEGERYEVVKNGKHGVVDSSGKLVVEVKWDYLSRFSKSRYVATQNGKLVLLKRDGQVAMTPKYTSSHYTDAWKIIEGLCLVQRNEKRGFIDSEWKVVIEPIWDAACPFREGVARVRKDKGWGLIDRNGKVVLEPRYEINGDMSEGLVWVEGETESGYVDRRGKFVIRGQNWKYCSQVTGGLALVQERDHGWHYRFIKVVDEPADSDRR